MINISSFGRLLNNDIFHELYEKRESIIDKLTIDEKKDLSQLKKTRESSSKKIEKLLENSPDKQKILDCIEDYIDVTYDICSYQLEKYYKSGLADGIKLVVQSVDLATEYDTIKKRETSKKKI